MTVDGDHSAAGPASTTPRVRAPRHLARRIAVGLLVGAVVVLVCTALLVRDAFAARHALTRAATQIPSVESALTAAASPGAEAPVPASSALDELRRQTDLARTSTDGPLWWLAARAPVVGPSAAAVADVARTMDDVSDDVLPALVQVADAVAATSRTPEGGLDLAPLQAAAPAAARALATVDDSQERLSRIDTEELMPELVEPVDTLRERLGELAGAAETAERATALAPPMLGADGPRTYLLLGLNPAELRAGGGIAGALILLRVDGGRVELLRQVSAAEVGPFDEPVLPLSDEDVVADADRPARFVQDVAATPDFPTSAALAAQMWARDQGEQVDGVLATDPVTLATLLGETGPMRVPLSGEVAEALGREEIEVGESDVVDVLLRRAYDLLDPEAADLFFADVAAAVLATATADGVDPATLLDGMGAAAASHRVHVWSAHEKEQRLLTPTVVSGAFSRADRAQDAVGVFLADHVAGKMSAYLDASLTHLGSRCTPQGRVDELELLLASTAPRGAGTELPWYVAGLPDGEIPPGSLALGVTVAGPRDGRAPSLERDGEPFGGRSGTMHGRPTTSVSVRLAPGEQTTLRLQVPAAPRPGAATPPGRLEIWSTPTVSSAGLQDVAVPVCG